MRKARSVACLLSIDDSERPSDVSICVFFFGHFQYVTDKDGSVMGVTVTRNSMLQHCRTLTAACNYTEGEVMVCVLDFKKDVGLWHSVLCVRTKSSELYSIPIFKTYCFYL